MCVLGAVALLTSEYRSTAHFRNVLSRYLVLFVRLPSLGIFPRQPGSQDEAQTAFCATFVDCNTCVGASNERGVEERFST